MILIAGAVFLMMGLLSGLFLVLAPLGATPYHPGLTTWILFPGLTILGYVFVLLPLHTSLVTIVSRATGGALLLLAQGEPAMGERERDANETRSSHRKPEPPHLL